jgi:hypothetical protein
MRRPAPISSSRRRGSIYIAVLIASMIVAIIGLSAITVNRIQLRGAQAEADAAEARLLAQSAVELGALLCNSTSTWRTRYPSGDWVVAQPLGRGSITLSGVDPTDASLTDSASEPLVLTGTGLVGDARVMLEARLEPVTGAIEPLRTVLHAGGPIVVSPGKTLQALDAPISTNGDLRSDGTVLADVEALSTSGSGTISDTSPTVTSTKDAPASTVYSDYAALAVTITRSGTVSDFVLAPGVNPWGATDPDGVYQIDTQGNDLDIYRARLSGTLLISCPGRTLRLREAVFFENYRPDYPTLIVDGNLEIDLDSPSASLLESIITLNPLGAPYNGATDDDTSDAYPKEIRGLIHVKGSVTLRRDAKIVGCLVCEGSASIQDSITLTYDRKVIETPPVGYTSSTGRMVFQAGSWRQVVLP